MNRRHGWVNYHERMARVLAHLHAHLDEPLDLPRLAELAHLSPFHWHRTYHALFGETLAATQRRLRLHRAAGELANGRRSVLEIAQRQGYPNAQSFCRAFKAAYGLAPLHFRRHGPHMAFAQPQAPGLAEGFEVQIRQVPRVVLAGLPHRGSYMGIGKAFECTLAQLHGLGQVQAHSRWIAVYHDDPASVPTAQLSALAGLSVPDGWVPAPPLQAFAVGGGRCAVLRYRGPYASMHAAYRWLFGHWLVHSGERAADQPVFEEFLNSPRDTAPADLLTDIGLPLAELQTAA
ncbi:AraC family transcriptional regulator [Aquabacterium sp. OR-4]|uniref:AraC family transcriptional regulator n=1 Tax=Aquabacterium sp. OR-4 TaxID=2978127 RepID=UPI0021B472BF|nr:AraC family transcriptional regulator [Aquabacterium sp. OR-4]MDT7837200.1 AraC family transcriptional regulator [Aquabacterium sp. OR-4]